MPADRVPEADALFTMYKGDPGNRAAKVEAIIAAYQAVEITPYCGVHGFRASIAPDYEPSFALIDRLGFVQVGDQWDEEDGLELIFEGDWPPATPTDQRR